MSIQLSDQLRRRRRGGFTLLELLVVIGIIVLLASIATPIIISARRQAERTRTQSDLNTIALALEAYKADFKDYPRQVIEPTNVAVSAARPVLAWALLGPWQAEAVGTNPADGADGNGFRTQWDKTNKVGSKVWGPYLPPDKFQVEIVPIGTESQAFLLDRFGSRIEYFPKWKNAKPGVKLFGVGGNGDPLTNNSNGAVSSAADPNTGVATSVYDCRQATPPKSDDPEAPGPKAIYYFQRALGDGINSPFTHNDLIDPPGEQLLTSNPPDFLLLSRGYRKQFSSKDDVDNRFNKTTEVTNLQTP